MYKRQVLQFFEGAAHQHGTARVAESLDGRAALRENGAVTALMTGSGAAVFGVFRTEAEAKAAADARCV